MEYEELIYQVTEVHRKRMTRKHKIAFQNFIIDYAEKENFKIKLDKSLYGTNIIFNDLSKSKHIIIAHYDTPPQMPRGFINHQILFSFLVFICIIMSSFINYIIPIILFVLFELYLMGFLKMSNPYNYNDNSSGVLSLLRLMQKLKDSKNFEDYSFVLMDNEEKGLLGSIAFSKKYKKFWSGKNIINLDCVGMGDNINLYAFDSKFGEEIKHKLVLNNDKIPVNVLKTSFLKASDHKSLKSSKTLMIAVEYKHKSKEKYTFKNIHSRFDKEIDIKKIDIIVDGLCKL